MRTVALSAGEWRDATERAAGVAPVVLPPDLAWVWGGGQTLPIGCLEACDFLYVNLHGLAGQPYWYGDGYVTAVRASEIRTLDLLGVVAFVTSCYAVEEDGRPGPMVGALLEAGCAAVVCGSQLNYSPAVDTLGKWLRVALGLGFSAGQALEWAKVRVGVEDMIRPTVATKDALQFVVVGDPRSRAGAGPGAVARRKAAAGAGRVA